VGSRLSQEFVQTGGRGVWVCWSRLLWRRTESEGGGTGVDWLGLWGGVGLMVGG